MVPQYGKFDTNYHVASENSACHSTISDLHVAFQFNRGMSNAGDIQTRLTNAGPDITDQWRSSALVRQTPHHPAKRYDLILWETTHKPRFLPSILRSLSQETERPLTRRTCLSEARTASRCLSLDLKTSFLHILYVSGRVAMMRGDAGDTTCLCCWQADEQIFKRFSTASADCFQRVVTSLSP
ncbi:hypothetical protein HPP92_014826 [Vanilla planifolia]|uniref:Uncharacterized protein n=1 Tax=Vanilla planifolia TaxID=51239 RepID=A0A835QI22_VANPL|nr:hypothetical protein HPP92_014826 [Vanilla planifolia]